MPALYELDGETIHPTQFTRGPWSPDHQHAGPPSALLARAVERAAGIAGGTPVRLAFDILRPVPIAPLTIATRVLRPGRNVEQIEATLSDAEHEVMRARVWRMRRDPADLGPADPAPEQLPSAGRAWFFSEGTAYADALEWRFAQGSWDEPGPAAVWTRMTVDLVAGEPIAPLEHLLVMGDAASGISAELDWREWNFLNVDFSVALERAPAGEWLCMDARTRIGGEGAAVCNATFSDQFGQVGSSSQAILVAKR